jgi:hypothetical protein
MFASLILLASLTGQDADPFAPARAGKTQCVMPNVEKKTCVGITVMKLGADGSVESTTTLLLNPTPAIAIEIHSTGKIKDDALCEPIRSEDYMAGKVTLNGQPADDATAGQVRTMLAAALTDYIGKTACNSFVAKGDQFTTNIKLDGTPHPELTQPFIWVLPSDGYKLGK